MSTILIEVRRAKPSDAPAIAATHDDAWRAAYQGIIPGAELEKLINRRGPDWWDSAIRKGSRIAMLAFGDYVAGYANYGRNRARSLYYDGEIYELYLRPEFQGLGFGRKLFTAARRDLAQSGLQSLVVWALSDNEPAVEILSRARRPGGGALLGAVRHQGARQGRLRLERLTRVSGQVWVDGLTRRQSPSHVGSRSRTRRQPTMLRESSIRASVRRRPKSGAGRSAMRAGRAHRVGEQARDRHRPDAARHRRDRAGDLGGLGEGDVADDARLAAVRRPRG